MTVLTPPKPRARRAGEPWHIVFEDVPWDFFERMLKQFEDSGQWFRLTYDDGRLELMVPGFDHECDKKVLARLIELYALEMDIPITGVGSLLLKRKAARKGLSPDECYYVNTPVPPRTRSFLDLKKYPPPDLGIEIGVSRTAVPRLPVYAGLKVLEVWRETAGQVTVLLPQRHGRYKPATASVALPGLPIEVVNRFLTMSLTVPQHEVLKTFREWVRSTKPTGRK